MVVSNNKLSHESTYVQQKSHLLLQDKTLHWTVDKW